LTSSDPEWRPHDELYAEEETFQNTLYQEQSWHIVAVYDEKNFAKELYDIQCVSALTSENPRFKMTPEVLAKAWSINQTIAKKTLEAASPHRAVRTVANPTADWRWLTGVRRLQYQRLHHQVFNDTMKVKVKSFHGNKCCEIHATNFG
jgi:hypothetical protein